MSVERFQRQAFETLQDQRLPLWGQLMRMLVSLQTGVLESLAPLYKMPFVRGAEVQISALTAAGTFNVAHKLGRTPRGFLVLDAVRAAAATGDLAVYRRIGDERSDVRLVLYASNSFESLTLWVW